jgi:hypothetical protein
MSTHTAPYTQMRIFENRNSDRARIDAFFCDNIGIKFSSKFLHDRFGSAFRSRKSEINRDPFSSITIERECDITKKGQERWVFWAVAR